MDVQTDIKMGIKKNKIVSRNLVVSFLHISVRIVCHEFRSRPKSSKSTKLFEELIRIFLHVIGEHFLEFSFLGEYPQFCL